MTIEDISIGLIEHGSHQGKPAVIITCGKKQELDLNEIIETIRAANLGMVFIEGNPSEYPQEIRDIIRAVSNLNTHIVLCCDASEAIENYRRIRTLTFCIKNKSADGVSGFRRETFGLLKPADNLVIAFNNVDTAEAEFDIALKFLMSRTVAKPLICLEMSREIKDKKPELFTKFLTVSSKFAFPTKISII